MGNISYFDTFSPVTESLIEIKGIQLSYNLQKPPT